MAEPDQVPSKRRLLGGLGTVRARTTMAALLVVGFALLASGLILVAATRHALTRDVTDAARLRATEVAAVLESGTTGTLAVEDSEDSLIQVIDGDGSVVASSPNVIGESPVASLRPGQTARIDVPVDDDEFRAVAVQARTDDGPVTVIVARTLESVHESTQVIIRFLLVGLPVLLAVVVVTTWALVGRALAPVEAIRSEVDAISAAELHRRVPNPPGSDEVARLADTMNRMLARLEGAQTRQRRFISDASHELRSPVAAIRQHAEVALAYPERTTLRDLADTVLAEDLRLQQLAEDLLLLARADEGQLALHLAPLDLDDLVFEEARRLRSTTSMRIDTGAVAPCRIVGDGGTLQRALRNVADNAAQHARSRVAFSLATDHGRAVVTVEDDGAGIATDDRHRVFDRFLRLDEARDRDHGGAGLGLAIVAEIVAAHGGTVTVGDSALGGAAIEISFFSEGSAPT